VSSKWLEREDGFPDRLPAESQRSGKLDASSKPHLECNDKNSIGVGTIQLMTAVKRGSITRRIGIVGALFLVVLVVMGVLWRRRPSEPDSKLLFRASKAIQENRNGEALSLAQSYLEQAPQSSEALFLAAQAADKLGRKDEALVLLARLSTSDSSDAAVGGAVLAGNLEIDRGHVRDAESHFRRVISMQPHDVMANRKLVYLLSVEGRRWESRPFLRELVSQQQHTVEELIVLGDLWPNYNLEVDLERFQQGVPEDPLPKLGFARIAIGRHDFSKAQNLLKEVIQGYPQMVEAQAWLGFTLVQDSQGAAELASWEAALPAAASEHPMIWLVRGMGATQTGQPEAAVRCFGEALKLDPNYDLAAYQLSRALVTVDERESAAILRRRTDELYELAATLKNIHKDGKMGVEPYRKVAEAMERLGRLREASAWFGLIHAIDPTQNWAFEQSTRLQGRLAEIQGDSLSLAKAEPELKLDIARYPLPKWPVAKPSNVAQERSTLTSGVAFVDSAPEAGINFIYFNGDKPNDARLLGTTGGGVAVLDYDGDGWPDIYFTQGSTWPVDSTATSHLDKLYRNLGNGKFEDVTEVSGLGDNRYSQGVAAGDFDNDGNPDLYLANLGVNRLYHNNGDGTFTDIAPEAGVAKTQWTTSCLVADLSGDGLPDLYDVNYVEGEALTRRCPGGPCAPHLFPGQDDRLLLNWGDGTFRDITLSAKITGRNGKGLGIVAADFGATGKLSLFVANDGTPNFFYENVTLPEQPIPRFTENGVLSGLAYDRNGVAQASMGVAADDATGDGAIDLFVTTFYNESNTFFVSSSSGRSFSDLTPEFGLRESSVRKLGFGAQFIDGELDGWPDLIVTNGHVQDHTKIGIPYKMQAQYYRNLRGQAFQELHGDTLGPFFEQPLLGRGLARLDWNRDGREEAVISHIGSPAALLTNQTNPAGHFLALQLRGVARSRDAIGAIVRLKTTSRTLTRQLTAGDGYQASNQRQLVFGLGDSIRIDDLEIHWPGGAVQNFANVAPDAEYIAVEGRETLVKRIPSGRK
jgi:tetratricopeptide (TPR) repeat protein